MINKKTEDVEMSFLGHLEVLRWHLIRSLIAIVILATLAFLYNDIVFDKIILAPKSPEFITSKWLCAIGHRIGTESLCLNTNNLQLINIKMAGQFTTDLMVSFLAGFIASFPYIFWEIWSFLRPALYSEEKKNARWAVLVSSLLFLTGILFAYFLIIPLSIHFLGSYSVSSQITNTINLDSYISTVTAIAFAGGIIFELPIVIYFLSKIGIITPAFLKKYRRHAVVVILTIAAIITPPDVFSQILVAIPLMGLYEIGIIISKRVTAKQNSEIE